MRKVSKTQCSIQEHFGDWVQVHSQCNGTLKTGTDVMLSFTSTHDARYPNDMGTLDVFLTKSKAMELLGKLQLWADENTTLVDEV